MVVVVAVVVVVLLGLDGLLLVGGVSLVAVDVGYGVVSHFE